MRHHGVFGEWFRKIIYRHVRNISKEKYMGQAPLYARVLGADDFLSRGKVPLYVRAWLRSTSAAKGEPFRTGAVLAILQRDML